jgi:AcrR family transcriptional regulator
MPWVADESWRRLSAEDRRSQLLELGHSLFNSRRYSEISVDDIARAAGISKGLLYHYFPSKEEFFLAGVERGCEQLLQATQPDATLPRVQQLLAGVRGYLDYVEQNSFGYLNLFRGETANLPGIQRVCEQTRRAIAEHFLGALGLHALALTATYAAFRGFQGYVEALVLDWLEEHELTRAQLEALIIPTLMSTIYLGLRLDLGADSEHFRALAPMFSEARTYLEHEHGIGTAG